MERQHEQEAEAKMAQSRGSRAADEHEPVREGHHFAAPEVEEWKPHPYEGEGLHRRESLKGDLPEEHKAAEGGSA